MGYLKIALERSASRTVDLSFSSFWDPIAHCIASHTERVVSLAVTVADGGQLVALWNCLGSGMHQLRTLTITFYLDADPDHRSWTFNPQVDSLSANALPRLTRVTAPAVLLPSLAIPSLQHITLENRYGRYSPEGRLTSYRTFCEALAACAITLETLVLLDVGPRADDDTPPPPISLPALRHLRVADTTRRCALVLSRLAFPDTTHINCTNVDNGALCATLPIDSPSIATHLSATDRVEIRGTADATTVHCFAGAEELLSVGLAGVRRGLRPDDLVRLFRAGSGGAGARVTHLAVDGLDGRDVQGVDLRAFPHLVRLDVRGEMAGYVLPNLARRDDEADGADGRGVVCPRLETLAVDFRFAAGTVKGDLGSALRDGDVAVAEADLRRRCAALGRVLTERAQIGGSSVTRLEFGCTEQGLLGDSKERKCDSSSANWESLRSIVEPLEKLVDVPVVFTGYHFSPVVDRHGVQ